MNPQRRSVRLNHIRDLLRARSDGYTVRELAQLTGVSARSIQRDLNVLQDEAGMPLTEERGRYALLREERLPPVKFNLNEARAILLATRLFLRYSDEADPFAASAIAQLARVMPAPVRDQVAATADALAARPLDAAFSRNLSTVTEAWARRRALRIVYRSAGKRRSRDVVVEPYFLEPSAAGFATYLIGYSRTHGALRTFKVERIVSAEMLPSAFELPAGFDADALLSSAWGIVWGEGQLVRLRFSPEVAWRVKESRWHPSQQIEETEDGGCLLTLQVGSLMELGRWVRSWGDAVEVLAPRELREELRGEAERLAQTYARPAQRPPPARRDPAEKRA